VHNCQVAFAVREGKAGIDLIQKNKYRIFVPATNTTTFDYSSWIFDIIEEYQPQVFILDVRDDLPLSLVNKIKKRMIKIVGIDDPSERRLIADLAFYPPVPQVNRMDWTGFEGKLYVGWEWVLLRPEFSIKRQKKFNNPPEILVTMGGSDPLGMTLTAIQALEKIEDNIDIQVILGPAFSDHDGILKLLRVSRHHYKILKNVDNMAEVMRGVDIAVVAFGVTAYELAAVGVPAVYLCISSDHNESARSFVAGGYGINLGEYKIVSAAKLCKAIKTLIQNLYTEINMKEKMNRTIDGLGSKRIAQRIMEEINE
jgi:spore coat polysaccharide biosynthesis protein SpsF